ALTLTMWVGLIGGAIAAREGRLLTLATGEFIPKGRLGEIAHVLSAISATAVATMLAFGSWKVVSLDYAAGTPIPIGIKAWVGDMVLPASFGLIALRLAWRSSPHVTGRAIAALGIGVGVWVHWHSDLLGTTPTWPWIAAVLAGALFGGPIFALLGGI